MFPAEDLNVNVLIVLDTEELEVSFILFSFLLSPPSILGSGTKFHL